MINDNNFLSLLGNSCNNNCQKILTYYWESQGFDFFEREFQRKVLGRVGSRPNTVNLLFNRSSKEDEL